MLATGFFRQLGGVPQHIVDRFPGPEVELAPLLDVMLPGGFVMVAQEPEK